MAKGLPRSMSRGAAVRQEIIKQVVKVKNVTVTVAGATGVGFGTAVIGDLPKGNILLLGAVAYMQFTGPTSANVADDWEGDFSIGSAATADATLDGAEVDIIPSTAIAAATAEASPRTRATNATQAMLNNTDNALELNLNLIVDDADIGADDLAFTANGELHLAYIVLGDDDV